MKRLLCIVGGMNAGGAETLLMKIYRALDKSQYQMDFAVAIEEEGYYDKEIFAMGGKIYHITPKTKGLLKNFLDIKNLVKREQYTSVLRTSQHSLSALELLAAKMGGARIRVFRSSNSQPESQSKKQLVLHKLCGFMPHIFANVRIAPSTEAAEFMFGKGAVEKGAATILRNAIDLNVFSYDETARNCIREELGISNDAVVIGHVGRFAPQKNHLFLVEIFNEIAHKNKNAVLLCVGDGPLKDVFVNRANELGVSTKILLPGVRADIPEMLSTMDVFLFPSLYEGMPNTVIEAQATGLHCVIADTITKEANVTGNISYISLNASYDKWADEVLCQVKQERKPTTEDMKRAKYDIESMVKDFVQLVY